MRAAHDTTHHFLDMAEGLAAIGAAGPAQHGLVESIDVSGGGVPDVRVGFTPADDQQRRVRPFEAVSVRSAEVTAPGPSAAAGSGGESLALRGIDWTALRPGTRLQVGAALLELSYPAVPSGWHAWVRHPGPIRTGNVVSLPAAKN